MTGNNENYGDGIRRGRSLTLYCIADQDAPATILSSGTQFGSLVGRELKIKVDEGTTWLSVMFDEDDFADPMDPTAAEVAAAIDAGIAGIAATAAADGRVQIASDVDGGASRLRIGDGTANPVFGWPQGLDVDASANVVTVPTFTEDRVPPSVDHWTYTIATQLFERIVPLVTETWDKDGKILTLPHAVDAVVHCYHIAF